MSDLNGSIEATWITLVYDQHLNLQFCSALKKITLRNQFIMQEASMLSLEMKTGE